MCVPGISRSTSLEGEAAASVAAAVAQEELGEEEAPPPYKHISCPHGDLPVGFMWGTSLLFASPPTEGE